MLLSENKIKQMIGQIESTIEQVEADMTIQDYESYCDDAYNCIAALKVLNKQNRIKERVESEERKENG